jgi:hypothetical protein
MTLPFLRGHFGDDYHHHYSLSAGGGGGSPAFLYKGNTPGNASLDIGTASAGRFIVVGALGDNSGATYPSTMTVAGVTINRDAFFNNTNTGRATAFYSGIVATGSGSQALSMSPTGEVDFWMHVWVLTGATFAFQQTASNIDNSHGSTISVTAGQFMFGLSSRGGASPSTWTNSTQSSGADHADVTFGGFGGSDWTISGTNASFNARPDTSFDWLVATYS